MERQVKYQKILTRIAKKNGQYIGVIDLKNILTHGLHVREITAIKYIKEMERAQMITYTDGVFEIKYYRKDL